jgi:hypothetical protein
MNHKQWIEQIERRQAKRILRNVKESSRCVDDAHGQLLMFLDGVQEVDWSHVGEELEGAIERLRIAHALVVNTVTEVASASNCSEPPLSELEEFTRGTKDIAQSLGDQGARNARP